MLIKNQKGNNSLYYEGYLFTQKTNLAKAEKRSCAYRCQNKTGGCHSSVSVATRVDEGVNLVVEPLVIMNTNIHHKETCKSYDNMDIAEKVWLNGIKEQVVQERRSKTSSKIL